MDRDLLEKTIHETIAQQILVSLDTAARDELLAKSIVDTLKSWDVQSAIAKEVSKKAEEETAKLMKQENWTERIREAIRLGFEQYLAALVVCTEETIKESLHGEWNGNQHMGYASRLVRNWQKYKGGTP